MQIILMVVLIYCTELLENISRLFLQGYLVKVLV